MDIGPSEAETFWTAFLRKLARCGLLGVKLVVSDPLEGIKATVVKVLNASWQRCRVHFKRNALAHAGKGGASSPPSSTPRVPRGDGQRPMAPGPRSAPPEAARVRYLPYEAETDLLAFAGNRSWRRRRLTLDLNKLAPQMRPAEGERPGQGVRMRLSSEWFVSLIASQ